MHVYYENKLHMLMKFVRNKNIHTYLYKLRNLAKAKQILFMEGVFLWHDTNSFFRITKYNADAHNTHVHSPL
jgi:hypothetical protein